MKPRDRVLIETKEDSFEGIIIPRPELLEKGIIVLKLDSGYNIGIEEKKIEKSEVIDTYKEKKISKKEVKHNSKLPTIAVLSYGGTISSKIDYKTGGVKADYDANDFLEMIPELKNIANLKAEKVMGIMSEDADLKTISEMSESLVPYLKDEKVDGIVMTMGTDTLHYIASALSFTLEKINKPIIITASQRSIDRGSSDAFMNLACAIKAAASWSGHQLVTCMHGSSDDEYCILINAAKVRKMHTSRRDAFRPINDKPFAKITYPKLEIEELRNDYNKSDEIRVSSKLSSKVALIQVYPGMNPEILDFYVEKGYKGLVLAGTALGHVPTDGQSNLLPALKRAIKESVVVAIATQTLYGRTHPYVYTTLRKLSVQLGCVFAEDMLPETAYMKLSWLLANEKNKDYVIDKFHQNLTGEINSRLTEDNFLY